MLDGSIRQQSQPSGVSKGGRASIRLLDVRQHHDGFISLQLDLWSRGTRRVYAQTFWFNCAIKVPTKVRCLGELSRMAHNRAYNLQDKPLQLDS